MAGVLLGSIGSGQAITRTGRYRLFPIAGTAIAAVGLLLLSGLDARTGTFTAGVFMFVMGLGLGLVMQVLVLAVQNAVPYEELGVATSGATLFRSMGGALGTAVLGAIFSNRLSHELAGTAGATVGSGSINPAAVGNLPGPAREAYTSAFTDSLSTVFLVAAAIVAVAFLLSLVLEERPLRQTVDTTGVGEAFAAPREGDSLTELTRELARAVGRDRTRQFIERTVAEAGLDLPPGQAWLLVRASHGDRLDDPDAIADGRPFDADWVREQVAALRARELVDGADVTPDGEAVVDRLLDARRECLNRLVANWTPEGDPRIDETITRIARQLAHDVPAHA
jgi:MFS family permease